MVLVGNLATCRDVEMEHPFSVQQSRDDVFAATTGDCETCVEFNKRQLPYGSIVLSNGTNNREEFESASPPLFAHHMRQENI